MSDIPDNELKILIAVSGGRCAFPGCGKLVITDLPSGIRGIAGGGRPLAQNDEYQGVVRSAGMPDKTEGFLYVNIHSTIPVVERLSNTHLPAEVSRNLRPLRSALEYAVTRSHEIEISFFLRVK